MFKTRFSSRTAGRLLLQQSREAPLPQEVHDQAVQEDEDEEKEEEDHEGDDDKGEDEVEDDVSLLEQLLLLLPQPQEFRVNPADLWLIDILHIFPLKDVSVWQTVMWCWHSCSGPLC